MRTPDDPSTLIEEPEVDSPLPGSHVAAALRMLGLVLLVFAIGALPLVRPDMKSGNHVYVWVVVMLLAVALVCIAGGWALRPKHHAEFPTDARGKMP